jgi:hypothetical protein
VSTLRGTRRFAIGFFLVYAIAVVYPGVALFRGPRPFVLGMPLAMVWSAAWVVAAFFVLLRLDHVYGAAEGAPDGGRSADGRADGGHGAERRPETPPSAER